MIVLDTDVVSELLKRIPDPAVVRRITMAAAQDQYTSSITMGEIAYGAVRTNRLHLFERAVSLLTPARVLSFDVEASRVYGEIRVVLEKEGRRLADPDLRIAAICLARGALLATGNLRHFSRISNLKVEDWLHS